MNLDQFLAENPAEKIVYDQRLKEAEAKGEEPAEPKKGAKVQKKNIELKENLQRVKVQGTNFRKDIETVAEKVDRKENQNFKVRLELTDTRKELVTVKETDETKDKLDSFVDMVSESEKSTEESTEEVVT